MAALLFGVHENNDPAHTAGRVGGNATRTFTSGVIGPRDLIKEVQAKCGPTWKAGQTAVWSVKPNPDQVRSNAWRAPFVDLAAYLREHPENRTLVVPWHEPENDVPKLFSDAADFVRLFETVAGWIRGANAGLPVVHAALGYRYAAQLDDAGARAWRTSADIHCLDIYSGRSNPLATILPELIGYRRWREQVVGDDDWGITERGWTITPLPDGKGGGTSAQRQAAMAREAAWLQAQAPDLPQVYLLWNTAGTEGDQGLVFDAPAEQVAKAMTAQYAAAAAIRAANAAAGATITAAKAVAAAAAVAAAGVPVRRTVTCPLCAGLGKYTFDA